MLFLSSIVATINTVLPIVVIAVVAVLAIGMFSRFLVNFSTMQV